MLGQKNPIVLNPNSAELFLLMRARDEAHRFAIAFHRKKRQKAATRSALDDIPGIGPKRRKELLRTFGSVARLRAAPEDAVARVIGAKAAAVVVAHLAGRRSVEERPESGSSASAHGLGSYVLIPARAGSRGLRDKNVQRVGGQPLLSRAIALAKKCRRAGEAWTLVVSTDSPRYARLARQAGAEVPFLRPAALASATTPLWKVVRHALVELERHGRSFDVVVMLSPTTPLTGPAAASSSPLALSAQCPP